MYMITIPNNAREAALMSNNESTLMSHRTAPLFGTGLGSTSAFGTPANIPANAGLVVTGARARDAKQAAPPRGELR